MSSFAFLDYLQSDRSNAANTRNQRFGRYQIPGENDPLDAPAKQRNCRYHFSYSTEKITKKDRRFSLYIEEIFAAIKPLILKNRWALEIIPFVHLLADSGARATEIATLNLDYFQPDSKNLNHFGKG